VSATLASFVFIINTTLVLYPHLPIDLMICYWGVR